MMFASGYPIEKYKQKQNHTHITANKPHKQYKQKQYGPTTTRTKVSNIGT